MSCFPQIEVPQGLFHLCATRTAKSRGIDKFDASRLSSFS